LVEGLKSEADRKTGFKRCPLLKKLSHQGSFFRSKHKIIFADSKVVQNKKVKSNLP